MTIGTNLLSSFDPRRLRSVESQITEIEGGAGASTGTPSSRDADSATFTQKVSSSLINNIEPDTPLLTAGEEAINRGKAIAAYQKTMELSDGTDERQPADCKQTN